MDYIFLVCNRTRSYPLSDFAWFPFWQQLSRSKAMLIERRRWVYTLGDSIDTTNEPLSGAAPTCLLRAVGDTLGTESSMSSAASPQCHPQAHPG